MTSRLSSRNVVVVAGAITLVIGAGAFGARPRAQQPDTMKELLIEVRGLRAAMEQLASAGPRVQLLFGRLQLQEQRINEHVKRLEAVRAKVKKAQEEESSTRAQIQRYEDFLRANPSSPERPDLERDLPMLRKSLTYFSTDLQRLQAEEAMMMSEINTEQNRWNDINRSLDELDRALTRR